MSNELRFQIRALPNEGWIQGERDFVAHPWQSYLRVRRRWFALALLLLKNQVLPDGRATAALLCVRGQTPAFIDKANREA